MPSSAPGGLKADEDRDRLSDPAAEDLVGHYETLRAVAVHDGARAGLGAALLISQGMAAWMRAWRACTPTAGRPTGAGRPAPPGEVVGVLAAMALACA